LSITSLAVRSIQHGYGSHLLYFDTTSADINNQHTDDNIELQETEIQKHTFSTTNLPTFWCHTKWKSIRVPWLFSHRS